MGDSDKNKEMKLVVLLCCVVALVAAKQACQDCPSCDPVANPEYPLQDTDGCSSSVVFVIDESSSLSTDRATTIAGLKQFWTGISQFNSNGGSTRLAVVEFSEEARIVSPMTAVDSALVTELDAYADSTADGIAGYSPAGVTNWAAAMFTVNTQFTGADKPDIVVFFTDGEPNSHFPAQCEASCTTFGGQGDVRTACFHADLIKSRGIKIFTVAVGDVLATSSSFEVISGVSEWNRVGSTFGSSDYVVDGDLSNLGSILAIVSNSLCPRCVECTIFPTNNNPESQECTSSEIPTLNPVTFTSSGSCGNARLGTGVVGFDSACRVGTITQTIAVFDLCDQETDRTESYDTVITDTIGPNLECPASRSDSEKTTCEQALIDLNELSATATDTCSEVSVVKSEVTEILEGDRVIGYETTFLASDACGNSADHACVVQYPCTDGADLSILKTSNIEECAVSGSEEKDIRYTITVKNNGGADAEAVVVEDVYPTGGELEQRGAITTTVGEVFQSATGFRWELGNLAANSQATLSFRIFLAPSFPTGIIENSATTRSPTPDPDLCNNDFTDHVRVCRESDLAVTKTDNEVQVTAGELFGNTPKLHIYEITVTNLGVSDANNVRLVDEWPEGFTFVSSAIGDGGACFNNQPPHNDGLDGFNCRWSSIPAGESRTVLATYTVPADTQTGPQINTVHVSSDSKDTDISNNHASDTTWVRTEADIAVTKDDEVDDVTAGDGVVYTYTIRVTNHGPSVAREVRLVDLWPGAIQAVEGSLSTSQGSCTSNTLPHFSFSCNHGELAPGDSARVIIQYTVPADTAECDAHNVVNVMSSVFDPDTCNNDASDTNAVLEKASLRIIKSTNVHEIQLGDSSPYEFTIAVFNEGPSTARQIHVTDTWPVWLTQFPNSITSTQGGCVTTGGDFSCALGSIPAGFQALIKIPFSLNDFAIEEGIISNSAVAFSPTDTQCRFSQVSIQVVEEARRRSDMSTEVEHVHIEARVVNTVENVMVVTLNVTNVHSHQVVIEEIKLDDTVIDASHCAAIISARSSEICRVEMTPTETKPKVVTITGAGSDGRPLAGKAQVNKRRVK